MRWIEYKLKQIATEWTTPEAMAATPTKNQIKNLKKDCIVELLSAIWMEIGGTKKRRTLSNNPASNSRNYNKLGIRVCE